MQLQTLQRYLFMKLTYHEDTQMSMSLPTSSLSQRRAWDTLQGSPSPCRNATPCTPCPRFSHRATLSTRPIFSCCACRQYACHVSRVTFQFHTTASAAAMVCNTVRNSRTTELAKQAFHTAMQTPCYVYLVSTLSKCIRVSFAGT